MASFNAAYARVFPAGGISLGIMTPFASPAGVMADVGETLRLAALADRLQFAALWTRDVPVMVPQGSDNSASALDDPFLWLGALASATSRIAIGAAAIVLPLHHPLHVAKSALTLDRISKGRFILGLGSGDRPAEFSAFGEDLEARGDSYRERWPLLRAALAPQAREMLLAATGGYDIMQAPAAQIPMIVVGTARQSLQWIATNADGWATYHREEARQQGRIDLWHQALEQKSPGAPKPFIQSVQLDLLAEAPAEPLELGLRTGRHALTGYLRRMQQLGVGHVIFNLSSKGRPAQEVILELGQEVLPAVSHASG
jgi:luciferase-type oxidoreductase